MAQLLKSFGKGCLYILVLPVLLVILAFYAVLGIIMFFYILIRGAILYFTGRNFGELPEDIKARAILEGKHGEPTTIIEDTTPKEEDKPSNNDYASHYYMPIDQSIPSPKEEDLINHDNPKDGGEL